LRPQPIVRICSIDNENNRWFDQEVHPLNDQLKAYLHNSFPDVKDADDVLQESYLRIWKIRAKQPIRSVKAYLYTLVRNLAIDSIRRKNRLKTDAITHNSHQIIDEEIPYPADILNKDEKISLLVEAFASLPKRCGQILFLHKIKGLSQHEVASKLGLTEKTVANQIGIGIKRCEKFFKIHGVEFF
jgi:RNA polymerase sigma factor (sigma-70 family)